MISRFGMSTAGSADSERRHFEVIASIAREEAGLVIPPEKAPMVFARLTKRLRQLGMEGTGAYCELVTGPGGAEERKHLICALTTNVTSFFREMHHFELLRRDVIPELVCRARAGESIRLWSAGCSDGSEPYSIAMTLLDAFPDAARFDLRILATDIDTNVLGVARVGQYASDRVADLSPGFRKKFLRGVTADPNQPSRYEIAPEVKRLVHFRELNLIRDWPMRQPFDVIFCRNVVIYFDQTTQMRLWERFEAACKPGGHLFLGHSERLPPSHQAAFRQIATTTYRRQPLPSAQRRT